MQRQTRLHSLSPVLVLLAFSVFINYVDRGNLSIAAPMLKDELGLSASQLGILLSSFFWTYGFFQILSGWLVDRLNVNWVMAIGFLLCSQLPASQDLCTDLQRCWWCALSLAWESRLLIRRIQRY